MTADTNLSARLRVRGQLPDEAVSHYIHRLHVERFGAAEEIDHLRAVQIMASGQLIPLADAEAMVGVLSACRPRIADMAQSWRADAHYANTECPGCAGGENLPVDGGDWRCPWCDAEYHDDYEDDRE